MEPKEEEFYCCKNKVDIGCILLTLIEADGMECIIQNFCKNQVKSHADGNQSLCSICLVRQPSSPKTSHFTTEFF